MKATQYKAIRNAGVSEFAIWPVDIEDLLPWGIEHVNSEPSIRACPADLVKAVIIKDDVAWKETFTLGCGDTEYARERRNGVLVQVSLEDFRAAPIAGRAKITLKALGEAARTKVVSHADGTRHVEMIVSKLAIMAPWGEYAMIQAEREKSQVDKAERDLRLKTAIEAIGARDGDYVSVPTKWDEKAKDYLPPKPDEFDYTVRYEGRHTEVDYLRGRVCLTLARAEEIAKLLGKL